MSNIYLMYLLWFLTGIVLVAYLIYRRKRKASGDGLKPVEELGHSSAK